MILLLAMSLAYGKVVTTTFARITGVSILGSPEHTLVIPPDFPEFENGYTGTWDVDFYDADITLTSVRLQKRLK